MQIIKKNNISKVEGMTNEDSSYPKENCINKQPLKISKSTSTESKIIFSASNIINIAFFNLNADTAKLELIDTTDTSIPKIIGSDIGTTATTTITSSTSDLSVFSDGDKILLFGFDSDSNNRELTVSGTPTATSLTVLEAVLTTESASNEITIIRFNGSDKIINKSISLTYCKTWTDYFNGNAILLDKFYTELTQTYINPIIQVTITGTNPSLGLMYAGTGRAYGISQYGTSKNINDNSIYRETINGSLNQVIRPVSIDSTAIVSCSREEAVALENLWKYDNSEYKVFILKYSEDDGFISQLILYGKVIKKPRLTWKKPDRFGYSIDIKSIGGYK